MSTYNFRPVPAWGAVGQFARIGAQRNKTFPCTLPAGGNATVVQGGTTKVGYVESDDDGLIAAFTTTDIPSVVVDFGIGQLTIHSIEAISSGAASAAAAATSATSASNSATAAANSASAAATAVADYAKVIPIKKYGAVGDGSADETAAFNAAIAAANATLGNDREGITGITFDLGNGRYKLPTALNPITVSGVTFRGISPESTTLLMSAASATFTFGDSTLGRTPVNFALTDCKVEYLADPPAGAAVLKVDYGFSAKLRNLEVVRIGTLVSAGVTATRQCGGLQVSGVKGSVANTGHPLFDLRYGSGLDISNMQVFVRGVSNPIHPAAMTTVAGTVVFKCQTGNWDTVQCSGARFERFHQGLSIVAASGMVYQNFFLTNTVMDYVKQWCIYAESQSGGVISGIHTDSACWFTSWETSTIQFTGAGFHDLHDVSGNVPISGIAALDYSVVAKSNRFCLSVGANSRASAAAGAVVFATGSKGFILEGSRGNDDLTSIGLPWRNDWGVYVGADGDDYIIRGCRFTGAAGGGYNLFAANAAGSKNRLVHNNIGTGYAGYGGAFTLAATTVANTNKTAHVWEVSIFGGTVTAIAKNGTTITGMTAGTLRVEPGETFTVTYSVAPTVSRFVAA